MASICTALSLLGAGALPSGFPAGWNGEAATPPLAFRTWNAFYAAIDASLVTASIDAMVGTDVPLGAPLPLFWSLVTASVDATVSTMNFPSPLLCPCPGFSPLLCPCPGFLGARGRPP